MGALRVCVSASAADRLSCARDVVRACAPGTRVLIVGASRGAADDLARSIAAAAPATFGVQRLSLTQLAAKTAILTLASDGLTSSTWLGTEAVAARVAFDATRDGSLDVLRRRIEDAGLSRARSPARCRSCGWPAVRAPQLTPLPLAGRDLADLLERVEASFAAASSADRAELFRAAARTIAKAPAAEVVVLLDLPFEHAAERELVSALVAHVLRPRSRRFRTVTSKASRILRASVVWSRRATPRAVTISRVCADFSSPPMRCRPSVSSTARSRCSRRPAKDASRSRSRAAF